MTIRVIFAPLAGRASDKSVLAAAQCVAKRFGAHIDVVSMRSDPRDAIPYLGEGLSGAFVEEFISQAEKETEIKARQARLDFDSWRDSTGFAFAESYAKAIELLGPENCSPSCSWREVADASSHSAANYGRLADLIIAPRGDLDGDVENEAGFETNLLHSGRPVLLAPPVPQEDFGGRIAIAWDGSAEAARAVGAALPFLAAADTVTAISVAEDGKTEAPLEALARYLSWHGIQADTRNVAQGSVTIGEALLGAVRHDSADFLVMGAYSHSRVRELVFGGATRYILDDSAMPVLMTH